MQYKVALHRSEEGFAASVPGLPGCWSQGATEAEALENIRVAIVEYLSVVDDQPTRSTRRRTPAARTSASKVDKRGLPDLLNVR